MKIKEAKDELVKSKSQLVESFEKKALEPANIKLTKEQLEEMRERMKNYPKAIIERNIEFAQVNKILNTVISEKQLHDKLDEAIEFLNELLKTSTD